MAAGPAVKILGRVRKLFEGIDAEPVGQEDAFAMTQQFEQLIAQGAAPYREIVKMGRAFYVNTTTSVASVVAIPTTAVTLALFNNEPDGGRSYVIDWVGAIGLVKGAAASHGEIIVNIGQVRETAPTNANLAIKKLNGLGVGNDTKALTIVGGTALPAGTGIAANWFPAGPAQTFTSAVAVGASIFNRIDGGVIVPPGRYFAMHTFSDVVTNTYQGFIAWHEVQLTLG